MGKALDAAYDRLTVMDIARASGRVVEFVSGDSGLCRSPFPELHSHGDKTPSFSIGPDKAGRPGKVWKNFAGHRHVVCHGGLLDFARECRPGADTNELRSWLVEIAGTGHLDKDETPAEKKERLAKWRQNKLIEESQREQRIQEERRKALRMPKYEALEKLAPDFVLDRYLDGIDFEEGGIDFDETCERLADSRGWPVEWCEALLSRGAVSRPRLPWAWTDRQRGWAFKCLAPVSTVYKAGERVSLGFAGYHQRFVREDKKEWIFIPYGISKDKVKTGFQKGLYQHSERVKARGGAVKVDPMPFQIGELECPQLIIICEGQWDAVTVYGALGGFADGDPIPVCVFGLRGVENAACLLKYWGSWMTWQKLRKNLQSIWIIADNDGPGMGLVKAEMDRGGTPRPTFRDVLLHNLKVPVECSFLKDTEGGKDFNDFYKSERPSVGAMWQYVEELKLLSNVNA